MSITPYFPELRPQCAPMGRPLKAASQASDSLAGLSALFGHFFTGLLLPAKSGAGSRRRDFPRASIFWAFLGQVLTRGASCRWALSRIQADAVARGRRVPDESTSAYCQARSALPLPWLKCLFSRLGQWFDKDTSPSWCNRVVRVIDGSGFSMPDSSLNRKIWPYAGRQKPGCGFPTGKLVGLFCLQTGRLVAFITGGWRQHDLSLARKLLHHLRPGEVLVADRGYCGWYFFAQLLSRKVDFVVRLHQARKQRTRRFRSWWEPWARPQRPPGCSKMTWARQPQELLVRLVRFQVKSRGFRTRNVLVVTSLLNEKDFPDSAIAELYARRWQVELHYRQIKTNLALDVLRGQSPRMIVRELWMHAIAYNLVRALMLEASKVHNVPLERISFKGALDAIPTWADRVLSNRRLRSSGRAALLRRIAFDSVPSRPDRSEPRAVKRRPKVYQLLTRPRRKMRVSPSRRW